MSQTSQDNNSEKAKDFIAFSDKVVNHINNYVVPQYGDKGEDIVTDESAEYCIKQIEKYAKRFGKNSRPGQELIDLLKIAHYAQMTYDKLGEEDVDTSDPRDTFYPKGDNRA